jgi:hypothetical protein
MPTNRVPIYRERRPVFSTEAVELFRKLEVLSPRQRDEQDEQRLARLLNLTVERWGGCDVFDRSRRPCWPPVCVAYDYWHRCRRVRQHLLAAVAREPAH